MIDFRKAFDLVDHKILLHKFRLYKCDNNSLTWFQSYLNKRQQFVKIGNVTSGMEFIKSGIPQGSIIGPLMFILFINDIQFYCDKVQVNMYADDTTLYSSSDSITDIQTMLNYELQNISKWCHYNNMVINSEKTKCMLIGSNNRLSNVDTSMFDVNIDGNNIELVKCQKLLGVHVDSSLTWKDHVNYLRGILNNRINLLRHLRKHVPLFARKLFYNSYILPHMDYCNLIWGRNSKSVQDVMCKYQKKAARLILNADFMTPSSQMFSKLMWLPFNKRLEYYECILIYKSLNGLSPEYITDMFQNVNTVHKYNLRSVTCNNVYQPKCHVNSIKFSSTVLWNNLDPSLKRATSLHTFKSNLYKYLMSLNDTCL